MRPGIAGNTSGMDGAGGSQQRGRAREMVSSAAAQTGEGPVARL